MKKYRFVFPKSAYVIAVLIFLSAIAGTVFSVLRLAEVAGFFSVIPAIDILTIVFFSVFIAALGLTLFGSYYAFADSHFVIAKLFFRYRIERDRIVKLVIDEPSGFAALYYFRPELRDVLSFVTVNLRRRDLDPFVEGLRAFKTDVVVEYNEPSSEEK